MSIKWGNYDFDGPFKLDDWEAPYRAAVYAIMYKNDPIGNPDTYSIVYFGESTNLSERGFPWSHEKSSCWERKAGSRGNLYIGVHYMPDSTGEDRREVEQALIQPFNPPCNME